MTTAEDIARPNGGRRARHVHTDTAATCLRCGKHELVEMSLLCGDCEGDQLAGLPCPECHQPMGDTDPPFLDGRRVCNACFEHETHRRSA